MSDPKKLCVIGITGHLADIDKQVPQLIEYTYDANNDEKEAVNGSRIPHHQEEEPEVRG